nr:MAG TPA: hypothetical protein [Caudoviricetes sp.]
MLYLEMLDVQKNPFDSYHIAIMVIIAHEL